MKRLNCTRGAAQFFSGVGVSDSPLETCFFVRFLGDLKTDSVSD